MKWKETITLNEQAIEKFKDNPEFKEQVETLREQTKRIKLLSPVKLNSEIPVKSEKVIIRSFKKLGIVYVPEKHNLESENIARQIFNDLLKR